MLSACIQLNSIGLSKNILRALSASKTDMPDLEAFPKSHVITFKYYVGVIQFLEENYEAVCMSSTTCQRTSYSPSMVRRRSISLMRGT